MTPTSMMNFDRPKRTSAELIALINQRQPDWWPVDFQLKIDRSAEHDWIAVVERFPDNLSQSLNHDFTKSLGQIVSDIRTRNAWIGR